MLACLPAAGVAASKLPADGVPAEGELFFDSTFTLPPQAYALVYGDLQGQVVLRTQSTVSAKYQQGSGRVLGDDSLGYLESSGQVSSVSQSGDCTQTFTAEPVSVSPGELAVSDVQGSGFVDGSPQLDVTLNPAGYSGDAPPSEMTYTTQTVSGPPGCAFSQQNTFSTSVWFGAFSQAHGDEISQQDFELPELTRQGDVFRKTYQRQGTWISGSGEYIEDTTVEFRPKFCLGDDNNVTEAIAGDGRDLGFLAGTRMYRGQVMRAPEGGMKVRLSGGDTVILAKAGDQFTVNECDESELDLLLTKTGRLAAEVRRALSGGDAKFKVQTPRAVTGVRGTKFKLRYNKPKQLTRVAVTEGVVTLSGQNGARGKVLVRPGQVGVQKGKERPRIVNG